MTPTVTYPSHTTMISGVLPAVHGIYNNRILDPEEDLERVVGTGMPAIFRCQRFHPSPGRAALRTAAVSWPVTVGADIDYLMPEFGGVTQHRQWLDLIRAISRPT